MKTRIIGRSKKIAAAFAAAVMLVSALPASLISASADTFPFGDVDMNNAVDSSDALLVMRQSVGLIELSDEQKALADVNGDNSVDSMDALMILQSAIGVADLKAPEAQGALLTTVSKQPSFVEEVTALCNEERAKVGLTPLEIDDRLCQMSEIRVNELDKSCSHIRPSGEKWSSILAEFEFNFLDAGENVAGGIKTPAEVVKAWMDSEGHRKNILNPKFTKIGVGYAFIEDSQYGYYWDQIFAGVSEDLKNEQASKTNFLKMINEARREKGLPALKIDTTLDVIAEIRATDITKKMDNKRPDGSDWKALLDEYSVDYWTVSQVYCAGQQNETEVFDYYMNGSKAPKFMDPDNKGYTKIGIGHAFVEDDPYGHYWVMIFTD